MEDLRSFAEAGAICDIQVGEESGVKILVGAVALPLHQLQREVHVDEALVHLDDTILRTGRDS